MSNMKNIFIHFFPLLTFLVNMVIIYAKDNMETQ